jgi:MerR family transcriptional regulator/heat shock protein HspR
MPRRIIPRDLVAQHLAVSTSVLSRYEARGLVQAAQEGPLVGYEPAQIRRLWTIVSFQRDLGVNLAGVELILGLFDRLAEVHKCTAKLAEELRELAQLEEIESPSADGPDD